MLAAAAAITIASVAQAAVPAAQSPVTVHLNYGVGLTPGSGAYIGFTEAARYWSSVLTTTGAPVTVNIDAAFDHLGPNILGSTSSNFTSKAVQSIETRLGAHAYGLNDAAKVLPALTPGALGVGALNVYTPGYTDPTNKIGIDNSTKVYDTDGSYNNSVIGLTTANAKALGYTFAPGTVDASITFSSDFGFDFNPRNGIDANKTDFLAVAIHEIGHALGFDSGVDDYDYLGTGGPLANVAVLPDGTLGKNYDANDDWFGETLDLFRYSAPGVLDWTTGTKSYFSLDGGVTPYENGYFSTGTYNGDSWQASHWKAPQVIDPATGQLVFSCKQPKLGILNPYICDGRAGIVTALDLAAQDAVGWNLASGASSATYAQSTTQIDEGFRPGVPEPASWALFVVGFGLVGGLLRRRSTVAVA